MWPLIEYLMSTFVLTSITKRTLFSVTTSNYTLSEIKSRKWQAQMKQEILEQVSTIRRFLGVNADPDVLNPVKSDAEH